MNNSQANQVVRDIGGLSGGDTFTDSHPSASHNGHTDAWTVNPSGQSATKEHIPSDTAKALGSAALLGY